MEIGFSDLDIICNLGIGIWNFNTVSGKRNSPPPESVGIDFGVTLFPL
jgi:hypothetical protein